MILKSGFNSIFSYLFCSPTAKKQKLFSTFSMHCFKQKTTEMRNNLFSFETSVKNKLDATSSHLHSLITTVCSAHTSPSHGSCPQRARRPLAPPAECHPATSHSLPTASGLSHLAHQKRHLKPPVTATFTQTTGCLVSLTWAGSVTSDVLACSLLDASSLTSTCENKMNPWTCPPFACGTLLRPPSVSLSVPCAPSPSLATASARGCVSTGLCLWPPSLWKMNLKQLKACSRQRSVEFNSKLNTWKAETFGYKSSRKATQGRDQRNWTVEPDTLGWRWLCGFRTASRQD